MPKNKKYISNIRILCEADIENGHKATIEARLKECIEKEDYEAAEGIKQALNKVCSLE